METDFLTVPVSFAAVYLILAFITKQLIGSFLGGLVVILIVYAKLSKCEERERKKQEKRIMEQEK